MKYRLSAIALLVLTTTGDAQTYVPPVGQRVKSGVPTRIMSVFNCNAIGAVESRGDTGVAQHGTIVTRPARQNRCGLRDFPVSEIWYTSQAGYRGRDEVIIIGHYGTRWTKTLTVQ
jgi:hypothetical protein